MDALLAIAHGWPWYRRFLLITLSTLNIHDKLVVSNEKSLLSRATAVISVTAVSMLATGIPASAGLVGAAIVIACAQVASYASKDPKLKALVDWVKKTNSLILSTLPNRILTLISIADLVTPKSMQFRAASLCALSIFMGCEILLKAAIRQVRQNNKEFALAIFKADESSLEEKLKIKPIHNSSLQPHIKYTMVNFLEAGASITLQLIVRGYISSWLALGLGVTFVSSLLNEMDAKNYDYKLQFNTIAELDRLNRGREPKIQEQYEDMAKLQRQLHSDGDNVVRKFKAQKPFTTVFDVLKEQELPVEGWLAQTTKTREILFGHTLEHAR